MQAIAGSYVVLLGWSMTKPDSKNILGFTIHRTDRTENEAYWLEGFKVFKETDPGKQKASLRQHPVQGFTWLDLMAKSGHDYLYRVVALKGKPTNLQEDASASVEVATELETEGTQSVWFNRGAAASQEYARRFNNRRPDEVGSAAFKTASETGADVQIIYDARKPDPAEPNRAAAAANIENLCTERTSNPSAIAHNKFIVLLKDNQPIAVWTGSTNFSEGGIFGHSNVGHEVRSSDVAKEYLAYWEILKEDPDFNALRPRISEITPTPSSGSSPTIGTTELFSPRAGLQLLDWYASQAASASMLVCMTFPFGINKPFVPTFQTPFAGLRYALFDSTGTTTEAKQIVLDLRKRPDNRFAIGSYLVTGGDSGGARCTDQSFDYLSLVLERVEYVF